MSFEVLTAPRPQQLTQPDEVRVHASWRKSPRRQEPYICVVMTLGESVAASLSLVAGARAEVAWGRDESAGKLRVCKTERGGFKVSGKRYLRLSFRPPADFALEEGAKVGGKAHHELLGDRQVGVSMIVTLPQEFRKLIAKPTGPSVRAVKRAV